MAVCLFLVLGSIGDSTTPSGLSIRGKRLGKLASLSNGWSMSVEDVDGDGDYNGEKGKQSRSPF